jgi:hypothetical protein
MKRTITGIGSGGFAPDYSFAQVSFNTTLGIPIVCQFAPTILQRVIQNLSEMAQVFRNREAVPGAHVNVESLEAVDATAIAPVGGGKVVLAIRLANNVMYHFSLAPELATRMLKEFGEAEESARRQAAQTRQ